MRRGYDTWPDCGVGKDAHRAMGWRKATFKDQTVWVEVDGAGDEAALFDEDPQLALDLVAVLAGGPAERQREQVGSGGVV
ncbi:MAG: hypothetical protein AAFV29_07195, partial [Myxococcota bacterium]